jgi:hypothetical protein
VGGSPHCWGFTIILRHTTLGRTPLDEWSARQRDLYLTTHSSHKKQTSTPGRYSNPLPSKRAAADPRLRLPGHWDRTITSCKPLNVEFYKHTHIQRITCGDPHGWWDDKSSDGILVRILTKCGLGGTEAIINIHVHYNCKTYFFSFSSTISYAFLSHNASCVQLSLKICFSVKFMEDLNLLCSYL